MDFVGLEVIGLALQYDAILTVLSDNDRAFTFNFNVGRRIYALTLLLLHIEEEITRKQSHTHVTPKIYAH